MPALENCKFDKVAILLYKFWRNDRRHVPGFWKLNTKDRDYWRGLSQIATEDRDSIYFTGKKAA